MHTMGEHKTETTATTTILAITATSINVYSVVLCTECASLYGS